MLWWIPNTMVIGRVIPKTKPVKVGEISSNELTIHPAPLLNQIPRGPTKESVSVDVIANANRG